MRANVIAKAGNFPTSVAKRRYALFQQNKKAKIDIGIGRSSDSFIMYDVRGFLNLLRNVVSNVTGNLSGVKIYFACYNSFDYNDRRHIPGGKEGLISLIFSPTVKQGRSYMRDRFRHNFDYYIMDADGYNSTAISRDMGHRWVSKFRDEVLPSLNNYETECLWYEIDIITTMITEVENGLASGDIQEMLFCYGAYERDETIPAPVNGGNGNMPIGEQLTGTFLFGKNLLYELNQPLTPEDLAEIKTWLSTHSLTGEEQKRLTSDDPSAYDTGIPIPPGGTGGDNTLP